MPHLDVYPMPRRTTRGYLLDVQADLLSQLSTRTVVPLVPQAGHPPPIKELNPVFAINGEPHIMLTQAIATVPIRELKGKIASLSAHHREITRALDILLVGY